jgi:hypothetical protein
MTMMRNARSNEAWYGAAVVAASTLLAWPAHAQQLEGQRGYSGGYASAAIDADEDSRYVDGLLGLMFGGTWGEVRLGRLASEAADVDLDATTAAFALGHDGEVIAISAAYTYREDSDSLEQQDLKGRMTYRVAASSFGLDVFYRTAEYETTASIERRVRDPIAIRATESVQGVGFGVHADWRVTPAVTVFGAAMAYDYDESTDLPAGLTRWERVRVSGVTRDELWLENSARLGLTYELAVLSFTAELTQDTTLYTDETIRTALLQTRVPGGERWSVVPWLGYSEAEYTGGSPFGGVEIGVSW